MKCGGKDKVKLEVVIIECLIGEVVIDEELCFFHRLAEGI